ncbi:MAG: protein kinase, partial [Planctomycetes bacterium]|nr:protein kinase [Planctomycetota bacterium]
LRGITFSRRYRIIREIARGGMGVVYEAQDLELGRRVAIKAVRTGGDPSILVARLRREATALARFQHPGLVTIYEIGTAREGVTSSLVPYIATEFVEGRTLGQVVPEMPLAGRVGALIRTAEAVDHAHRAGVVHRDLKPANVLVTGDGRIVVIDFGLARWIGGASELTQTGERLGTFHYMAPEQVEGRLDEIGPWTDVWALGVMLYEFVHGRRPFEGEGPLAIVQAILSGNFAEPASAPRALGCVYRKALSKDPRRRHASAAEFARAISGFRGDESPAPTPSRQRTRRPRPAPARAWAPFAAGVLVALAGIAVWMASRHDVSDLRPIVDAPEEKQAPESREVERAEPTDVVEPPDLVALRAAAREDFARGAWSDAQAACERALAAHPGDPEILRLLARVHLKRAQREAHCAVTTGRGGKVDPALTMDREEIDLALARFEEAFLVESRASAPGGASPQEDLDRQVALAYRALKEGRSADLAALCEENALRFAGRPGGEEFPHLLGWSRTVPESRLAAWDEAVRWSQGDPWFLVLRALALYARGEWDGARSDCEAALSADPVSYAARLLLGLSLEAGADHREAEAELSRAIELRPDLAAALLARSLSLRMSERPDEALADCDQATQVEPGSSAAHHQRGLLRSERGDRAGALADYDRALELDPGNHETRYRRGSLLFLEGRSDDARSDLLAAVSGDPGSWEYWRAYGLLLDKLGRRDDALDALSRARDLAPGDRRSEIEGLIASVKGR